MANYIFTDNKNFAEQLKTKMILNEYYTCTVELNSLEAFLLFKREALPKFNDNIIVVGRWTSNLVSSSRNLLKAFFLRGDTMSLISFNDIVFSSIKCPFKYAKVRTMEYSIVKIIDKRINSFLEKLIDELCDTLHRHMHFALSSNLAKFNFSPETDRKDIGKRLNAILKKRMRHVYSEQEKLLVGSLKMPVEKTAK